MKLAPVFVALSTITLLTLPHATAPAEAQVESTGPRLTKQPREGFTFRGCFASGMTKPTEGPDDFYDEISKAPRFPDGNIVTALTKTGSWQLSDIEVLPRHAEGKPNKQQQGASRPEVRQCIANARAQLGPGDQFVFLYTGHGMPGGGLAIGPHDDPDFKGGTIVPSDLTEWLSGFRKGVSITVILLSCYGYAIWDSPNPAAPGIKNVKFKDENGKNTIDAGPYLALITSAKADRRNGEARSGDIHRLVEALKLTDDHQCPHPERGCGRFAADKDKDHIVTAKEAADYAGYYQAIGTRRCFRCTGSCAPDNPDDLLQFDYFGPPPRTMETRGDGPGSGTVVAEPPDGIHWETPTGIDCTYQNRTLSEEGCKAIFTGAPVRLRATATDGSVFGGWSGDVGPDCTDQETCDVEMTGDRTVTATFTRKVSLRIAGAGAGSGTVTADTGGILCTSTAGVTTGTCDGSYDTDAMVTLTAAPTGTSTFAGWSGACAGLSLTCIVSMKGDQNVTATFGVRDPVGTHKLVVTVVGWPGRITSSPAGIDCANGTDPVATCEAFFSLNTVVKLTVTAGAGPYQFGGWFGGPCMGSFDPVCAVTITQDETQADAVIDGWPYVVIHFATASPNGIGSGTVTSSPAGINCGTDGFATLGACQVQFPAGSIVTLTATPTNGSVFGGWFSPQVPECDGSTNPVCRFTVPRGDWPNILVGFGR
jgi:Divergent InlB B-repeat domain